MKIRLVVATRQSPDDFLTMTATGRSFALYSFLSFVELRLFPNNKAGLPEVYNIAIEESVDSPATLVFAHDDLNILDYFWVSHLELALQQFQIVGLAGNSRRSPKQPAWFQNARSELDNESTLSGIVGHGNAFPPATLSAYGPADQEVKLLDGLFIGCRSQTLIDNDLRFDERFDFDFYDLDFCRQAEMKQLRMGTCTISVIHESVGNYNSQQWQQGYELYMDKWGD
jgi:hypothetical protein